MMLRLTICFCSIFSISILATPDFNKIPTGDPKSLCYNGKKDSRGVCICDVGYAGKLCERKKHCLGFERDQNYGCLACTPNWLGKECDFIDCKHGIANKEQTECECDKPYSGQFCDQLKTTDVYLFYNKAIYSMGPLGVISILPLILILIGCNWLSKKDRLERTEKAIEEQFQKDISPEIVQVLLKK